MSSIRAQSCLRSGLLLLRCPGHCPWPTLLILNRCGGDVCRRHVGPTGVQCPNSGQGRPGQGLPAVGVRRRGQGGSCRVRAEPLGGCHVSAPVACIRRHAWLQVPQRIAMYGTPENLQKHAIDPNDARLESVRVQRQRDAARRRLSQIVLSFKRRANENSELYGSVTGMAPGPFDEAGIADVCDVFLS